MSACSVRFVGRVIVITLVCAASLAAQKVPALVPDTQVRGYWVDPSTGLVWGSRDNSRDVNWYQATKYCLDLELGGYDDWRIPTISQLKDIFDPAIRGGWQRHEKYPTFRVKGNLLLTGDSWSTVDLRDADGTSTGWVLLFDFAHGMAFEHEQDFRIGKRALCVRGSGQAAPSAEDRPVAPDTLVRGYWVDASTGLMWAGRDNFGRDLKWREAAKYCLDSRLAGYDDWRLPTIVELESIYDRSVNALGLGGERNESSQYFHVKGDLFLTGLQWSASHAVDGGGRFNGQAYRFDFINGGRFRDEWGFHTSLRALCVRGEVHPSEPSDGARSRP